MGSFRKSHRFLALFLGLVVALSLDWGVRQLYLIFIKKPRVDRPAFRAADEFFHHGIQPSAQGVYVYGPHSAEFFSNSLGLRDAKMREVPLTSSQRRILFIGDSFTEAGPISWEKSFVGRMAQALADRDVEVLNAGVASYCPTLQRVKLRQLIQKQGLKVDRVVLCLDISDLKDEFYYEEGADGRVHTVAYGPFHEKAERLARADAVCNWLEARVEKNFVILGAIIRNARLQWRRHASSTGVTEYDAVPEWAFDWPDYQGPYAYLVEQGLQQTKKEMSRLAEELRLLQIPLTLVVYPWPQQVRAGTRPSRAETEWAAWAKENGADFISLFPIFVNQVPPDEILKRYYWKNDCHWNEEGHRLVAETLLKNPQPLGLGKK